VPDFSLGAGYSLDAILDHQHLQSGGLDGVDPDLRLELPDGPTKRMFPTAGVVNGVATTLNLCSSRKAGHR
jgi:hypothetical protein